MTLTPKLPQGDDPISAAIRHLAARIDELDARTIRMVPLGPRQLTVEEERLKSEKQGEEIRKIFETIKPANTVPPVDRSARELVSGEKEADKPDYRELKENGQQKDYVVLSEEERRKGFVRPVRRSYKHVGKQPPKHLLRDLTLAEKERYSQFGYVKFEEYPADSGIVGCYWTQADLDKIGKGCGTVTGMGQALAETYARDPSFYSGTFCVGCGAHFPVGEDGEFVWVDHPNERVGT
jgi:hypothetical protein